MPGRPGTSWRIALAVALTASLLARPAYAGPWTFGAGGGWTSGYDALSEHEPPSAWFSSVAVSRVIQPSAHLKIEVAALTYEAQTSSDAFVHFGSLGPGFAAYSDDHRATFVPIAAGLRWDGPLGRSGIAPYLEFMPTLFVVSWDERSTGTVYYYEYGPSDSTTSFGRHQSFTRGVLGVSLGVGFHIRGGTSWDLDYGFHFRQSAPLDHAAELAPGISRESLRGLAVMAMTMGISWSPSPR